MSTRTRVALTSLLMVALGVATGHAQTRTAQRIREFAALPDWTGLWETEIAGALLKGELDKPAAVSQAGATAPAASAIAPSELAFLSRMQLLRRPPYNSEWESKSQAAPQGAGMPASIPAKICGMTGFPALMESPVPDMAFQTFVTPEETLFLFPDGAARHIHTDGRPHPGQEDLWPTDLGDSVGHWEDATLVIDTVARKAGPILPIPMPGTAVLSAQAHFTERVKRIDASTLQDDMTIDDPQRFAHPWKVSIRYQRVTGIDRMIPNDCTENDRNPIVNGKVILTPP
jgi:hypothetical protein